MDVDGGADVTENVRVGVIDLRVTKEGLLNGTSPPHSSLPQRWAVGLTGDLGHLALLPAPKELGPAVANVTALPPSVGATALEKQRRQRLVTPSRSAPVSENHHKALWTPREMGVGNTAGKYQSQRSSHT